jgi:Pyridine nucleotide-disulphide oxidoreductase, dimerisation domain
LTERSHFSGLRAWGSELSSIDTIVARHAGEMINGISLALALAAGIGLATLSDAIHAYPTQAEGIRQAADACVRSRRSTLHAWLVRKWLQR